MSKTFREVFDEIKANVTTSKKGKVIKSFSKSDFDRLAKAFVNETEFKTETVGTKDGKSVSKEVMPVKKFREGFVRSILLAAGVDKKEAQVIVDSTDFSSVDGMYEFVSELIYQYMNSGKKFDFLPKDDFNGSISLKDIGLTVGEFTDMRTKERIQIQKEAHKILEKKSKCPKSKKKKLVKKK